MDTRTDTFLDAAGKNLMIALEILDQAERRISEAYNGEKPGIGANRAWDYIAAIDMAREAIGSRLNIWDNGNYPE